MVELFEDVLKPIFQLLDKQINVLRDNAGIKRHAVCFLATALIYRHSKWNLFDLNLLLISPSELRSLSLGLNGVFEGFDPN